jgi:phosphoribosyl 1,2-cyclic phosphate phosphodiesterase
VRLRFLGTGTSFGIPVIGCACAVCNSPDARDRRFRHAALLSSDDGTRHVLVDTPPELRLQLVGAGVRTLDAVFFTHAHADHIHGIDDVRIFSARQRRALPAFADPAAAHHLRTAFPYIFDLDYEPPEGTTRPEIELRAFEPGKPCDVGRFTFIPFEVPHGDMAVFGFRVGALGYVTDAKTLPAAARRLLEGVRVLVLNALWHGDPHPTHFNIEEAVDMAARIGAERTYLTHLTHRVSHAALAASLPPGIEPAYDGLVVDVPDEPLNPPRRT